MLHAPNGATDAELCHDEKCTKLLKRGKSQPLTQIRSRVCGTGFEDRRRTLFTGGRWGLAGGEEDAGEVVGRSCGGEDATEWDDKGLARRVGGVLG